MEFTKEQQRAIEITDKNILVSAAAGSGKTAVLVERIIRIILDGKADIDNMLIVTFTNAAAAEIRAKIVKAIKKEITADKEKKEALGRQLDNMYKANISTFHSFAIKIIKEFFYTIDIEPDFTVCDEAQGSIMENEIINEIFEEAFDRDDLIPGGSFIEFLTIYSSDRNEELLMKELLENYNALRSIPDYFNWAENKLRLMDDLNGNELLKAQLKAEVSGMLKDAQIMLNKALEVKGVEALESIRALLVSDADILKVLYETMESDFDNGFYKAIGSISFGRINVKKEEKVLWEEIKDEVVAYRDEFKSIVNRIKKEYFYETIEEQLKELAKCKKYTAYYIEILKEFERRFEEKKRNQGLMDFSDIEHKALKILANDEISDIIRGRLKFIFIDEYQDTNYIQESLIGRISKENNLFKVGDVKQSIYGFRQAEPGIFIATRDEYEKDDKKLSTVIDLNKNFRSKGKIIDFINHVFEELMDNYDSNAKLYKGVPYFGDYDAYPELHIIDAEDAQQDEYLKYLGKIELEAMATANVIKEKIGKDFHDSVKDEIRPMEPRDIVILLRSTKNQAEKYYKELIRVGVNAFVSDDDGYFNTIEVNAVFELLCVLDNMKKDIPLISVLHSKMFDFTTEELGIIRAEHYKGPYWEAFNSYIDMGTDSKLKNKCREAKEILLNWRAMANLMSIDKMLWKILIDSNYYLYVGTMPRGKQRQANLRALIDKAIDYQNSYFGTIHDFVNYLNVLKTKKVRTGQAKIFGEEDNLVRIMTVHKSKGLEFPCVILAGLGKKLNYSNLKSVATINSKIGIGLPYIDKERAYRRKTLLQRLISGQIKKEEYEEELRVLYVAMTRAREQLLIMALSSDMTKENEVDTGRSTYMKILGKLIFTDKIKIVYENSCYLGNDINESKKDKIKKMLDDINNTRSSEYKGEIASRLEYTYPHREANYIKSKYSVSELNKDEEDKLLEEYNNFQIKSPDFINQSKNINGADVGNVYHKIMEMADFEKVSTYGTEYLMQVGNEIIQKNLAQQEALDKVDYNSINDFFNSEIGIKCIDAFKAGKLYREKPFTLSMNHKGEDILVQGIIDCYFTEGEDIVLLDYKSNKINEDHMDEEINRIKALYLKQIKIYKEALEKGLNKKVKGSYLYLFTAGRFIDMD